MNAVTKTQQKGASPLPASAAARFSPALRQAVKLRVRNGLTIGEACRAAGISDAWWYKSWLKPAFQQLYEQEQTAYIQEVESLRAGYKAQAFAVAAHLMHHAKSEAVRMRAVEFFAGGPQQPSVVVQVNNSAPGYTYRRPTDSASGGGDKQPIEIEGKASEV